MMKLMVAFFALWLTWQSTLHAASHPTEAVHAERTHFQETGTYAEVDALCTQWAQRHPQWVRCQTIGKTAEGRNIRALIVSKSGVLQAAAARRKNIPVMLVIGGTHAGEIDGKDASLILTRSLLTSSASDNPLKHLVDRKSTRLNSSH